MHALLVPIRDERRRAAARASASRTAAHKLGLNGVDNGRIWFDHVRVPRESAARPLRAASAADGTYSSPIENPTKRFFTMLGTLIQGRVSVCGAAISATKVALTIAVRRGARRAASSAPPGERRRRC